MVKLPTAKMRSSQDHVSIFLFLHNSLQVVSVVFNAYTDGQHVIGIMIGFPRGSGTLKIWPLRIRRTNFLQQIAVCSLPPHSLSGH